MTDVRIPSRLLCHHRADILQLLTAASAPAFPTSLLTYDAVYHVPQRTGYTQTVSRAINTFVEALLTS